MKACLSKTTLAAAALALATAFTFTACGSDDGDGGGSSPSGGGSPEHVPIGNQVWMAKNSDIEVPGSECYDKESENCAKYGRLYSWEAANNACPFGFHLPSKEDWDALAAFIESDKGCSGCDAKHLKAKDGWTFGANGLDSYGFAALPGGFGFGSSDGDFSPTGWYGYWWSASENDSNNAYVRSMIHMDEGAFWGSQHKASLYSVRCLQD